MTLKTIIACALCLLVGLVIGYTLSPSSDSSVDPAADSAPSTSASRSGRRSPLGSSSKADTRSRRLDGDASESGELAEKSGLLNPSEHGRLVVVPASLIDVMSRAGGIRSGSQELFSRDGKHEAYLQISDQEKASMQRAWRQVQAKVKKLESDSSQFEDLADGSVRITVPDLASDIGELGGGFQSGVTEVLGENRGNAFLAIKQLKSMFKREQGERIYTVKMEAVGDGTWRYRMSFQGPGGKKAWVGDSVPTEIRHLTDRAKIKANLNPPDSGEDDE